MHTIVRIYGHDTGGFLLGVVEAIDGGKRGLAGSPSPHYGPITENTGVNGDQTLLRA